MLKHNFIVILVFIRMTLHADCDISENPSDEQTKSCGCATNRKHSDDSPASKYTIEQNQKTSTETCEFSSDVVRTNSMKEVTGGTFTMGTNSPVFVADREQPARKVTLSSFLLDVHEVSNMSFYI